MATHLGFSYSCCPLRLPEIKTIQNIKHYWYGKILYNFCSAFCKVSLCKGNPQKNLWHQSSNVIKINCYSLKWYQKLTSFGSLRDNVGEAGAWREWAIDTWIKCEDWKQTVVHTCSLICTEALRQTRTISFCSNASHSCCKCKQMNWLLMSD